MNDPCDEWRCYIIADPFGFLTNEEMNRRVKGMRVVLAVVILGCIVASLYASDPPTDTKPVAISFKATKLDNQKLEGSLTAETISISTDFGQTIYKASKVRSLTFRHQDDQIGTSVELDDHSRMQGKLLDVSIAVTVDGQAISLNPKELKDVKFIKKIPFSLIAAMLGLITLAAMEIVLGIDNIIFLAILVGKVEEKKQPAARRIGLAAALGTRIILLLLLSWLIGMTRPLFTLPEMPFLIDPEARDISFRDIVLFAGGLFLVYKSVKELHHKIEAASEDGKTKTRKTASFAAVIVQIAIIDIVFSFDSVITAVGMVEDIGIMIAAMVIAMLVMLLFAAPISKFVDKNPTVKTLALSFLILIGVLLIAESLGQHIDKGYIYFAMAFAVCIELLNLKLR